MLDGVDECDYEELYKQWASKQQTMIQDLQRVLEKHVEEEELQQVVHKAHSQYEAYYDAIDATARRDVLQIVDPSWKTPLEKAFMWLGEWRPSTVYQLVYALAGQQVEEELKDLLSGIEAPSMVSLSASQLEEIHRMQMRTVEEEDRVRDYVARLQQSMADKPMLISLAASGGDGDECGGKGGEMKKGVMGAKLKQLQELALRADLLRRRTLAGVLRSLNPLQRAQFLLASSQLNVAMRHVGERLRDLSA